MKRNISFQLHTVWRIDDQNVPLFMERYSTTVTSDAREKDPDAIVKLAYGRFVRDEVPVARWGRWACR